MARFYALDHVPLRWLLFSAYLFSEYLFCTGEYFLPMFCRGDCHNCNRACSGSYGKHSAGMACVGLFPCTFKFYGAGLPAIHGFVVFSVHTRSLGLYEYRQNIIEST